MNSLKFEVSRPEVYESEGERNILLGCKKTTKCFSQKFCLNSEKQDSVQNLTVLEQFANSLPPAQISDFLFILEKDQSNTDYFCTVIVMYSPSEIDSRSVFEAGVKGASNSESREIGIRHRRDFQNSSIDDGRHS